MPRQISCILFLLVIFFVPAILATATDNSAIQNSSPTPPARENLTSSPAVTKPPEAAAAPSNSARTDPLNETVEYFKGLVGQNLLSLNYSKGMNSALTGLSSLATNLSSSFSFKNMAGYTANATCAAPEFLSNVHEALSVLTKLGETRAYISSSVSTFGYLLLIGTGGSHILGNMINMEYEDAWDGLMDSMVSLSSNLNWLLVLYQDRDAPPPFGTS